MPYDEIRVLKNRSDNIENDKIDFSMKTTNSNNNSWVSSILSKTQIIFYGTLIGITLIIMFIIN